MSPPDHSPLVLLLVSLLWTEEHPESVVNVQVAPCCKSLSRGEMPPWPSADFECLRGKRATPSSQPRLCLSWKHNLAPPPIPAMPQGLENGNPGPGQGKGPNGLEVAPSPPGVLSPRTIKSSLSAYFSRDSGSGGWVTASASSLSLKLVPP